MFMAVMDIALITMEDIGAFLMDGVTHITDGVIPIIAMDGVTLTMVMGGVIHFTVMVTDTVMPTTEEGEIQITTLAEQHIEEIIEDHILQAEEVHIPEVNLIVGQP